MADDKLRSCMRKYFDLHNPGDYCLLISGKSLFRWATRSCLWSPCVLKFNRETNSVVLDIIR